MTLKQFQWYLYRDYKYYDFKSAGFLHIAPLPPILTYSACKTLIGVLQI